MGEYHRAVVAYKQAYAQIVLQLLDITAKRGRRHVAAIGGAAKVQAVGKAAKQAKFGDIHEVSNNRVS